LAGMNIVTRLLTKKHNRDLNLPSEADEYQIEIVEPPRITFENE
jgi:hypothetical protein